VSQTAQEDVSKSIASGIAITCIIFAVSIYIPIIGFLCSLFIPLPVLFFRSKLGRTFGTIVPVVSIILIGAVLDGVSLDVLFFVELLLLGFILSELIEMNLSVEKTILYTCSTVIGTGIFGVLFYSGILNKGITDLISDYISKNLALTMVLYEKMGVPQENIHMLSSSLEKIKYILVRITPSLIAASTLFVAWTSLLLAKPILKSRNLYYPDFGPLNLWKAPEYLVWGVILCGGMLLLPDKSVKMFGLNGLIILMTIYFFEGIAIVSFFFEKKRFPRAFRIFLYILIALQQVMLFLVIGLGFFDMWLNFRKLGIKKSK